MVRRAAPTRRPSLHPRLVRGGPVDGGDLASRAADVDRKLTAVMDLVHEREPEQLTDRDVAHLPESGEEPDGLVQPGVRSAFERRHQLLGAGLVGTQHVGEGGRGGGIWPSILIGPRSAACARLFPITNVQASWSAELDRSCGL